MTFSLSRKLVVIFSCMLLCIRSIAQTSKWRNEQVRGLNDIIDYMDATSRIQQQIFFDAIRFLDAYVANIRMVQPTYWQVSVQQNARSWSEDYTAYKEVQPDRDGFISDYQYRMIPVYRSFRKLERHATQYPIQNTDIQEHFNRFKYCFDRMEKQYGQIVDYIHQSAYKTDNGLRIAKQLLDSLQPFFDQYNESALLLYNVIVEYYNQTLPPLNTQKTIRLAQEELLQSVRLVEDWAQQLFHGDDTHRSENDARLRELNKIGHTKAPRYLANTYGYNYLSNGAYPHTRYDQYYQQMYTTIFWFKADTIQQYKNIPITYENYNKFVNRYNAVMEYYNRFIECADGYTSAANMDYTPAMAARLGVDTAQNVLLKKPRISYKFGWNISIDSNKQAAQSTITDTVQNRRHQMILNAIPHHTVYLLDVSNSMLEENKLDTLKQGMKYLVELQRPADRISIIAFADNAVKLMQFEPCDAKNNINETINHLQTNGATNAEAALTDGYRLIDSTPNYNGQTKMVIITDGQFTLDKKTKKKIKQYQTKGIFLSILLLGRFHSTDTIEYFKELCKQGNGNFYDMHQYNLQEILVKEACN
ncbi:MULTISPECIES: vWA domain-containing protein [Chitinophagaceae]